MYVLSIKLWLSNVNIRFTHDGIRAVDLIVEEGGCLWTFLKNKIYKIIPYERSVEIITLEIPSGFI